MSIHVESGANDTQSEYSIKASESSSEGQFFSANETSPSNSSSSKSNKAARKNFQNKNLKNKNLQIKARERRHYERMSRRNTSGSQSTSEASESEASTPRPGKPKQPLQEKNITRIKFKKSLKQPAPNNPIPNNPIPNNPISDNPTPTTETPANQTAEKIENIDPYVHINGQKYRIILKRTDDEGNVERVSLNKRNITQFKKNNPGFNLDTLKTEINKVANAAQAQLNPQETNPNKIRISTKNDAVQWGDQSVTMTGNENIQRLKNHLTSSTLTDIEGWKVEAPSSSKQTPDSNTLLDPNKNPNPNQTPDNQTLGNQTPGNQTRQITQDEQYLRTEGSFISDETIQKAMQKQIKSNPGMGFETYVSPLTQPFLSLDYFDTIVHETQDLGQPVLYDKLEEAFGLSRYKGKDRFFIVLEGAKHFSCIYVDKIMNTIVFYDPSNSIHRKQKKDTVNTLIDCIKKQTGLEPQVRLICQREEDNATSHQHRAGNHADHGLIGDCGPLVIYFSQLIQAKATEFAHSTKSRLTKQNGLEKYLIEYFSKKPKSQEQLLTYRNSLANQIYGPYTPPEQQILNEAETNLKQAQQVLQQAQETHNTQHSTETALGLRAAQKEVRQATQAVENAKTLASLPGLETAHLKAKENFEAANSSADNTALQTEVTKTETTLQTAKDKLKTAALKELTEIEQEGEELLKTLQELEQDFHTKLKIAAQALNVNPPNIIQSDSAEQQQQKFELFWQQLQTKAQTSSEKNQQLLQEAAQVLHKVQIANQRKMVLQAKTAQARHMLKEAGGSDQDIPSQNSSTLGNIAHAAIPTTKAQGVAATLGAVAGFMSGGGPPGAMLGATVGSAATKGLGKAVDKASEMASEHPIITNAVRSQLPDTGWQATAATAAGYAGFMFGGLPGALAGSYLGSTAAKAWDWLKS